MISGIYAIVNQVNEKRYVGSSVNIFLRWQQHKNALRANRHENQHLQRAWTKYGESAFSFIIVDLVLPFHILDVEQKHLDKNKDGYNIAVCALATQMGLIRSRKTRDKIRAAKLGKPLSLEHRAKLSASGKGRVFSEETCSKISAAKTGKKRKPFSEQAKRNMSLSNKGKPKSPQHCAAISAALKRHSRETRAKISKANTEMGI